MRANLEKSVAPEISCEILLFPFSTGSVVTVKFKLSSNMDEIYKKWLKEMRVQSRQSTNTKRQLNDATWLQVLKLKTHETSNILFLQIWINLLELLVSGIFYLNDSRKPDGDCVFCTASCDPIPGLADSQICFVLLLLICTLIYSQGLFFD